MELVIMAAGMGSRFGGLKQIAPMGPNDEFIIDYSIYDAIQSGFDKVVFIIKEENYDIFKETIGSRVESHIPVEYVFQKITDIPKWVDIPDDRVKPWGTAQAIYAARKVVKDSFLVINADDFYGRDAFKVAAKFLKKKTDDYALVGYRVVNTLTENGSVKRGVIETKDGVLDNLIESSIIEENGVVTATPLDGSLSFEIDRDSLVSMNMLCFRPTIFKHLGDRIDQFFEDNKDNMEKCEFLIPDVLDDLNKNDIVKVNVLDTKAVWYGVTYKEDTDSVRNAIRKLVEDKVYPKDLWK